MQPSCLSALFSVVDTELKNFGPVAHPAFASRPDDFGSLPLQQKHQPASAAGHSKRLASSASKRQQPQSTPAESAEGQAAAAPRRSVRARRPSQRLRASSEQEELPVTVPKHKPAKVAAAAQHPGTHALVKDAAHQSQGSPGGHSSASSDSSHFPRGFPIFVSTAMDVKPSDGVLAAAVEAAAMAPPGTAPGGAATNGVVGDASSAQPVVAPGVPVPSNMMPTAPGAGQPGSGDASGVVSGTPVTNFQAAQAGFYNFPIPVAPGQPYQYYAAPGMMPGMNMAQMYGGPDMGAAAAAALPATVSAAPPGSPPLSHQPPQKKQRQVASGFASKHPGTSAYRGVSWHSQTSRWKSQIKVNGRDINLGRHKDEMAAARAYDRAAICARGVDNAKLNFPVDDYQEEVGELASASLDDLAASLRGVEERMQAQTSRYHGVRLNKRTKKWEAYIRVNGKHVHLGCYDHEVAAAQAFDQAAIVRHAYNLGAMGGKPHLVTNFPPDYYQTLLQSQQDASGEDGEQQQLPPATIGAEGHVFYKLEEKYVQNLVDKCREQGGQAGGDQATADQAAAAATAAAEGMAAAAAGGSAGAAD